MRQTILRFFLLNIFTIATVVLIFAQNSTLDGYILEDGNRGYVSAVSVTITQQGTNKFITSTTTNDAGFFTASLPVGYQYLIRAYKDSFLSQQAIITVDQANQNKKIFARIKMSRQPDHFVDKSPQLSSPELINAVIEYGIDTKKISPSVNPDGVALTNLVNENDVYAEVTNATRLVDENYVDATDKELMKTQPIPTNYQSPIRIDPSAPRSGPKVNKDLPNPYGQKVKHKIIIPEPEFGETMVAAAQNNPRTHTLPLNYTGYKIEFYTTLSALSATHKIFNRHGNIVLERKENGLYSYLLGDFVDKQLAATFLQETLLDRYPTATLIEYENGQRKQAKKTVKVSTKPVSAPPR